MKITFVALLCTVTIPLYGMDEEQTKVQYDYAQTKRLHDALAGHAMGLNKSEEEIALEALDKGADPNGSGYQSETPLWLACRSSNEKVVQELVRKNANINRVSYATTPLEEACLRQREGSVDMIRFLIDNKADLGESLHYALIGNNYLAFNYLLSVYPKLDQANRHNKTALITLCMMQNNLPDIRRGIAYLRLAGAHVVLPVQIHHSGQTTFGAWSETVQYNADLKKIALMSKRELVQSLSDGQTKEIAQILNERHKKKLLSIEGAYSLNALRTPEPLQAAIKDIFETIPSGMHQVPAQHVLEYCDDTDLVPVVTD